MKLTDFKEVNGKHIESCYTMIKEKSCKNVECKDCPFNMNNLAVDELIYCLFEDCDKLSRELLDLKHKGDTNVALE